MDRHPNILNAATNLLGICFIGITGLNLTEKAGQTFADEVAWVAALGFLVAALMAYLAIRSGRHEAWYAVWADRLFIAGVLALTAATIVLGLDAR